MDNNSTTLFWIRKIQSFLGIVPAGIFLLIHLGINSSAVVSSGHYSDVIAFIRLIPYVTLIEYFGIIIPLSLHMILGLYIIITGKMNVLRYSYKPNWSYTLQRISGIFLVIFLCYHLWNMKYSHQGVTSLTAVDVHERIASSVYISVFYLAGVLGAIYHLFNGIFNFSVKWGIVIGRKARLWWSKMCLFAGIGMAIWGVHIWWVIIQGYNT